MARTVGAVSLSVLGIADAAGWALLVSIYVPAVQALYERGYGSMGAVVGFIVVPAAMALLSLTGPIWLVRRGRTGVAAAIAALSLLCLLFALLVTAALLSI